MAICQRCLKSDDPWRVPEARVSVGGVDWKLRLCRDCTAHVETAVLAALKAERKGD